jgi:hypothetical protein
MQAVPIDCRIIEPSNEGYEMQGEMQGIGKNWLLAVSRFHLSFRFGGLTQCKPQDN